MNAPTERILIVESDPQISAFLQQQALEPAGYATRVSAEAGSAIRSVLEYKPDLVIADLNLPGLSGKDLLVALTSQGIQVPVIGLAHRGMEKDIIQAFRLGAVDYLAWPAREAEVLSTVERVIRQVCGQREREAFTQQQRQMNSELERRVREFSTIFTIGKAVTTITDGRVLFGRIMDAALSLTDAGLGWILLQDKARGGFVLSAQRNLPDGARASLNQVWQDGISTYTIVSGETAFLRGEQLQPFPVAALGQAALVSPIKLQNVTAGVLVCMRKDDRPFTRREGSLLEALADYAAIALANIRMVRAMEDQAQNLKSSVEKAQAAEKAQRGLVQELNRGISEPLQHSHELLEKLLSGSLGPVTGEQREALARAASQIERIRRMAADASAQGGPPTGELSAIDLTERARQAVARFQRDSQSARVALVMLLPSDPVRALGDPSQVDLLFDGLLSNALRFSPQGGQVTVRVDRTGSSLAHASVQDEGKGIAPAQMQHLFDEYYERGTGSDGPTVSSGYPGLRRLRTLARGMGGDLWADSKPNSGATFHFTLKTE